MDIKQFLKDIKAKFNGEVVPPAPPAPPVPPAPATPTAKTYKLADGVTEITINQSGETPATGDTVMIGGAPAPANTYTLSDGSTIVVDANGAIATYTAMAAPPPPPPPAPPAPPPPVTLSAEEFEAMVAKFAVGSTEERLTNAEIMLKALMECNFGYEIRKGKEAAAIEVYKETLAPLQISVEAATLKLESQFTQIEAQKETIAKHQQTIKDLFDLVEKLVELPTAEPVTLTDRQKQKFDKQNSRDEKLARISEALKKQKALA